MSGVPIFVQMSLTAILHLNNTLISAAEFQKDTKEFKLDLLYNNAQMKLKITLKYRL